MTIIEIQDPYNASKTHLFKFYSNRTVYYNQAIDGIKYYSRFVQVNLTMGYSAHLLTAKKQLTNKQQG